MTTAFTPGPWRCDYDDNGFYYIFSAEEFMSPYIAATGGEGHLNEANARLIAAAPDMYEALKMLADVLNAGERPDVNQYKIARAALAKVQS